MGNKKTSQKEIYFNSKSNPEYKYLSNFYGNVEICFMQKRFKHPKMKQLFEDFKDCNKNEFIEFLKLLQPGKKLTKYWFDGDEPIRGILAKLVGMIITNPESNVFKKRAKDIANYLNISIDDVLKSDKITTDNDMKKCLVEKYKIPQFKKLLLKTGDKILHEQPMRGQPNDWTYPGNDKLGKMLISIRNNINKKTSTAKRSRKSTKISHKSSKVSRKVRKSGIKRSKSHKNSKKKTRKKQSRKKHKSRKKSNAKGIPSKRSKSRKKKQRTKKSRSRKYKK